MKRRINREVEELSKIYSNVELDPNKNIIVIGNKRFVMADTYPFSKPAVYVNDVIYSQFLRAPPRINQLLIKEKFNCLCCKTILCDWSPMYKISTILNEITSFNKIKESVKAYLLINEISKKYEIINILKMEIYEYLSYF